MIFCTKFESEDPFLTHTWQKIILM